MSELLKTCFITECVTKTGMILLVGEVTSKAKVDLQTVVRKTVESIGYDDSSKGAEWLYDTLVLNDRHAEVS